MIANLCPIEDILLDAKIQNRRQLFDLAARHLQQRFGIPAGDIAKRLEDRERLGSTGLGLGVAIPHARIPELKAPRAVFIRPERPIAFGAPDGKPVGKFLLILIPENATQDHLQQLANAARMFSQRPFRDSLREATSPYDVSRLLRDNAA